MTSRTKRLLIFGLVLCVLAVVGGYGAFRVYVSARQARLINQAKVHLAKPNEKKALLCLQRALKYNAKDVEACRLMADLTERLRSPSALIWRSRVVELSHGATDDRLALAQTAMTFRDYVTATNTLQSVDTRAKTTAAYHKVAGAVASTVGELKQAEAHFLEATRLDAQDEAVQLSLAVVRLHGTNANGITEARASLSRLSSPNSTNAALSLQASRELVVDAMRNYRTNEALSLSQSLLLRSNSVFSDRLLRLYVLHDTQSPEFKKCLAAFQREAATEPTEVYELAMWQLSRTSPKEVFGWLETLPSPIQTNQPVALLMAECRTAVRDWRGLQESLELQNWGELEFIRRTFRTHAFRGQEKTGSAKSEWELALKTANYQKPNMMMLLRLATQWKWEAEAEELLWAIVNRYPEEKWATQDLMQALFLSGRTRPLMMLYRQELKRSPANLSIKNDLAATALLLNAEELKPHELALEVYQKSPTNVAFASTYAFSLYKQEKYNESLRIMEELKPDQLQNPTIAGYYGLILQATGNTSKAKACAESALKGRLLPEERKLFERLKSGV